MITELIKLLPDYYNENVTMQELQRILSEYVKLHEESVDAFVLNARPDKSVNIERWESIYGIKPDASMGLEYRRQILAARMIGVGKVNLELIQSITSQFVDAHVTFTENFNAYQVTIYFDGMIGVPLYFEKLYAAINDVIPAHIEPIYIFLYNTHESLGDWPQYILDQFTHAEIHDIDLHKNTSSECQNLAAYTCDELHEINISHLCTYGTRKVV